MLSNPQTTDPVWRNEVSRRDLSSNDDCRMVSKLLAERSHVSILRFGEQTSDTVQVERMVSTKILVGVIHAIAIRA